MKFYDYENVGEIKNAYIAHDNGFFVGNQPFPLDAQLNKLFEVLDKAAVPG